MKRLRVLVLVHPELVPPDSLKGHTEQEINDWKTEYDVVSTLRAAGHEVRPLGVENELKPIRDEIESWKPDVVFNLLEQFHGEAVYDQNVASYLELLRMPYTCCNPRGLVLARGFGGRQIFTAAAMSGCSAAVLMGILAYRRRAHGTAEEFSA